MGKYELKKSIGALPLFQQKLEQKELKSGSVQLAHMCNKMLTALESKGFLRTAPEEFLLASRYRPEDPLAAEFIRTFRTQLFHGASYLAHHDALKRKEDDMEARLLVPKAGSWTTVTDEVSLYGFRDLSDARLAYLSPWQFEQWWYVHRLKPPNAQYQYSRWLKQCDTNNPTELIPGEHFGLNEHFMLSNIDDVVAFPKRTNFKDYKLSLIHI